MASYNIRDLQLHLLDVLLRIDAAFRRAGLRYYLVDGSLIGAVREGGFIPWDDDMDIAVPRPDYERLIRYSRDILPEGLEFVCHENDPSYPLHFGKIQDAQTTLIERPHLYYLGGVYVDIFPIDGAPVTMWRRRTHVLRYNLLRRLLYLVCRDPYRHQRSIRREMMCYDFDRSRFVGVNLNDGLPAILPKAKLGAPTPIMFEGRTVMGMADNDYYLTRLFGDYMTPPPPAARKQHNFFYCDLKRAYREFNESDLGLS